MILEKIKIENFRSYHGSQTIDLGGGLVPNRNVVAVGGLNGAGKTSLKDAITFGLLGYEDAFKFVRGIDRKGNEKRAIDRELNGLINREAFASGEHEAKVTLFLRDNEGAIFAVERRWQFDTRGNFKREDLAVVRNGDDFASGVTDPADLEQRFSDFLKNHVPPEVAKFFLFDGEQIQRIAQDEPEVAVRDGIGLLLGFHLLDSLAADIDILQDRYRKEARKRSQQEVELDKLRVQEKELDNKRKQLEDEKQELEDRVDKLRSGSRRLVEELRTTVGGSGKDPRALQDELDQVNKDIQRTRDNIQAAVDQRITPALAGELVRTLSRQLTAEDARAQWEEGKLRVEPQREKLISKVFGADAPTPEPRLGLSQSDFLQERIRKEWDELFNPPPEGIAKHLRHGYLSSEERNQVRARCDEVLRSGTVDLNRMITELDSLSRVARDLRISLDNVGDSERAAKLVAEKGRIDKELGDAEAKWEAKKRELMSVHNELKEIRKQVSKKDDELNESGESAGRADYARRIKRAVDLYKEALRPRKRDELAKHLGDMYRLLARKEDVVQSIELDEQTFSPRLLDRRGNPISLDSQSAGEKEIYALSLLWALAKTSRRELPVVIDTPLARLDSAHRSNIVRRYLPQAGNQVIVLSTDTEIDREYFDLIEDHIAKSFRLDFDAATERTTVEEGYFDFD